MLFVKVKVKIFRSSTSGFSPQDALRPALSALLSSHIVSLIAKVILFIVVVVVVVVVVVRLAWPGVGGLILGGNIILILSVLVGVHDIMIRRVVSGWCC
jgi:hypothetical protein